MPEAARTPDPCIWCGQRPAVHNHRLCDHCLDREWRWAHRIVQRHDDEVEETADVACLS